MMLADMGADVVRVDRPGEDPTPTHGVLLRGRRSVVLDLKAPDGVAALLALAGTSDVLLEGFRPGVAERLGCGPEPVARAQPRARLRPDDRLGPGRAVCRAGRPRHHLPRGRRASSTPSPAPTAGRCRRSTCSATSAAAGCCSRSASLAALLHARRTGAGTGGRRGDRRRGGRDDGDAPLDGAVRAVARGPRRQPLRRWRAVLPVLPHAGRPVGRRRRDRAALLGPAPRRAGPRARSRRRWTARPGRQVARQLEARFATRTLARVVRGLRRPGRLRGAGPHPRRGPPRPAPAGPGASTTSPGGSPAPHRGSRRPPPPRVGRLPGRGPIPMRY